MKIMYGVLNKDTTSAAVRVKPGGEIMGYLQKDTKFYLTGLSKGPPKHKFVWVEGSYTQGHLKTTGWVAARFLEVREEAPPVPPPAPKPEPKPEPLPPVTDIDPATDDGKLFRDQWEALWQLYAPASAVAGMIAAALWWIYG